MELQKESLQLDARTLFSCGHAKQNVFLPLLDVSSIRQVLIFSLTHKITIIFFFFSLSLSLSLSTISHEITKILFEPHEQTFIHKQHLILSLSLIFTLTIYVRLISADSTER